MGYFSETGFVQNIMYFLPRLSSKAMELNFVDIISSGLDSMLSFLLVMFCAKWIFKIIIDLSRRGGK